jgi:hypothetical protein
MDTTNKHFEIVCLGGGNAAGYLARELVAGGLTPGRLCIVTDEKVRQYNNMKQQKSNIIKTLYQ